MILFAVPGRWQRSWVGLVFLAVMVGVIALAASVMQLIRAEVLRIDLLALFSPFVFSVLPAMAVIAALAVLFETIPWLRGTFGNVVYMLLWFVMLLMQAADMSSLVKGDPANDVWGIQVILASMMHDTAAAFPGYQGGVAISLAKLQAPLETFPWSGIHWTTGIIFGRIMWLGAALGISLLAAICFRRFDPTPGEVVRPRDPELLESPSVESVSPAPVPVPVDLAPLTSTHRSFFPARIFLAELRLLFKGMRWWWIILFIGVNVAGILLPLEPARQTLLPIAWIIPLGLWSALGTGALFIPSLALALGVWSGSNKLFEVVYMLWWYVGPINRVESLDFMGAGANLQMSKIYLYGLLTVFLLFLAVVGRKKQLSQ